MPDTQTLPELVDAAAALVRQIKDADYETAIRLEDEVIDVLLDMERQHWKLKQELGWTSLFLQFVLIMAALLAAAFALAMCFVR